MGIGSNEDLKKIDINLILNGDVNEEDCDKVIAFSGVLDSFKRFCGLFYKQLNVNVKRQEKNSRKKFVFSIADTNWKWETEELNITKTVKEVFEQISQIDAGLKKVSSFFCKYKLWLHELHFLNFDGSKNTEAYLDRESQTRKFIIEEIKNEKTFREQYFSIYLLYMDLVIMLKSLKFIDDEEINMEVPGIIDKFSRMITHMYDHYKQPLLLNLLCSVKQMEGNEDTSIVEQLYLAYVKRLGENTDVMYECSKAFYDLGHYFEDIVRHRVEQDSLSRERSDNTMYLTRAIKYYDEACQRNECNYRFKFKRLLIDIEYFSDLKESVENLRILKNKMDDYLNCTFKKDDVYELDINTYIYSYKIKFKLHSLMNPDTADICLLKELENLIENRLGRYIKNLGSEADIAENDLKVVKRQIESALLYARMYNYFKKEEGLYSEEGKDYFQKYHDNL